MNSRNKKNIYGELSAPETHYARAQSLSHGVLVAALVKEQGLKVERQTRCIGFQGAAHVL